MRRWVRPGSARLRSAQVPAAAGRGVVRGRAGRLALEVGAWSSDRVAVAAAVVGKRCLVRRYRERGRARARGSTFFELFPHPSQLRWQPARRSRSARRPAGAPARSAPARAPAALSSDGPASRRVAVGRGATPGCSASISPIARSRVAICARSARRRAGAASPVPPQRVLPRPRRAVLGDGHIQGGRDLARVHAGRLGLARRVGGDRADRRGPGRRGGDERAAALLAFDQALLLQALVDGADGVDVQAARLGHLAQARQALPGPELAVADARATAPSRAAGRSARRRRGRSPPSKPVQFRRLRLCAHFSTVAPVRADALVCW